MREITCSTITDAIKKMCIEAATILPQDVEKALSQKHCLLYTSKEPSLP